MSQVDWWYFDDVCLIDVICVYYVVGIQWLGGMGVIFVLFVDEEVVMCLVVEEGGWVLCFDEIDQVVL